MEYDEQLDPDVEQPDPPAPEAPLGDAEDPQVRKLKQENQSLRRRFRRLEVEAEHGKEIAGLIPDSMPLGEWKEYADKLAGFRQAQEPVPTEDENADAPTEEQAQREQRLAAVAAPQASGTPQEILSPSEIGELMQTDPQAGLRAAQAKYGNPS